MTKAPVNPIDHPKRRRARAAGLTRAGVVPAVIPDVRGLRKVCFVSGTRAEFGLMRTTLEAIRAHEGLGLQIVCAGMHLDPEFGADPSPPDAPAAPEQEEG